MQGEELRKKIDELTGYISEMRKNGLARSRPGTFGILKENRKKLIDRWMQTPDAAEYAKSHGEGRSL